MALQPNKCKYIIFTRRRRQPKEISLHIDGVILEEVPHYKYLGVWLDRTLTWRTHITRLEEQCQKRLNLLKAVMGLNWGASRKLGKTLYIQYIRIAMDYGAILYGTACNTHLSCLDKVQNSAMRINLGLPKSTVAAMAVEAQLYSLSYRRTQLDLNYLAKRLPLQGRAYHTSTTKTLPPLPRQPLEARLHHHHWQALGYSPLSEQSPCVMALPSKGPAPWSPTPFRVHYNWTNDTKKETPKASLCQQFLAELDRVRHGYHNLTIYTDASHADGESVNAIGLHVDEYNLQVSKTTSNEHDIARCELLAIWEAVQLSENFPSDQVVICSDSKSALAMLHNRKADPLVHAIYVTVTQADRPYVFLWCPSHTGIEGNEYADRAVITALFNRPQPLDIRLPPLPYTWKRVLRRYLMEAMERDWLRVRRRASPSSLPPLLFYQSIHTPTSSIPLRRSNYVAAPLPQTDDQGRYGKTPSQDCSACGTPDTIAHILTECPNYSIHHDKIRKTLNITSLSLMSILSATTKGHQEIIASVQDLWHTYSLNNKVWRPLAPPTGHFATRRRAPSQNAIPDSVSRGGGNNRLAQISRTANRPWTPTKPQQLR